MFRVNVQSNPLWLVLIFHQWVKIFAWNFTQQLTNNIYTLLLSSVELLWKMTKLCCFNHDNPYFSAFEHHAKLVARELSQVHWNSPDLNSPDCYISTIMSKVPCWKSAINSSRRLRRQMSWKSPCRPPEKSCHKNTLTRRWLTSPSAWPPVVTANDGHFKQPKYS